MLWRFDNRVFINQVAQFFLECVGVLVDYLLLRVRQNVVEWSLRIIKLLMDPVFTLYCQLFESLPLLHGNDRFNFVNKMTCMLLEDFSFTVDFWKNMFVWLTSNHFETSDSHHFDLDIIYEIYRGLFDLLHLLWRKNLTSTRVKVIEHVCNVLVEILVYLVHLYLLGGT